MQNSTQKLPKILALYEGPIGSTFDDIKNGFQEPLKTFFECFQPESVNLNNYKDQLIPNLRQYDALIMRPKWGGTLTAKHMEGVDNNLCVATLSVGRSHIFQPTNESNESKENIDLIKADYGNLDATAELAIWMAITLRRKLHLHCMSVTHGGWDNKHILIKDGGGLKGGKWAILGTGALASRILARLPGLGVSKVKAWYHNDKEIEKKFEAFVNKAHLANHTITRTKAVADGNPGYDTKGKPCATKLKIHIEASSNLNEVIQDVDVVCMALSDKAHDIIKLEHMKILKDQAVFINLGRAEAIHKEVYAGILPAVKNHTFATALQEFSLESNSKVIAFGSDVLTASIEKQGFQVDSIRETHKVWNAFSSSMCHVALLTTQNNPAHPAYPEYPKYELSSSETSSISSSPFPNVLLTPHLGGATPESEKMIAEEVLEKLLEKLGIYEKYEVFYRYGKNLPNPEKATPAEEHPGVPHATSENITLGEVEKNLCEEIKKDEYDWPEVLSCSVNFLVDCIFTFFNTYAGGKIFLQRNEERLPCHWEFDLPASNTPSGSSDGQAVQQVEVEIDSKNVRFSKMHLEILKKCTLNAAPITLSDGINFALRVGYTIITRKKTGWRLYQQTEVEITEIPLDDFFPPKPHSQGTR